MALNKALAAKLNKAKASWAKAKTRAVTEKGGGYEIEDGRYLARLTGAEINESKSSSRVQVQWTYKIVEGDYKGSTKLDFDGLETEDNLMYLARKVAKFGYEAPDDLEEIDALLTQIVAEKPLVKIRLKTKGGTDFQNVYLDAVISADDEDEVLADAATEESEDADADAEAEPEAEAEAEEEEVAEEEVAEEEGEVELTVGMKVVSTVGSKKIVGEIVGILDDEQLLRLKMLDGPKKGSIVRVPINDNLAILEETEEDADAEEDVPEAPVAKAAAKPAAKPAAAPIKKKK